MKTYVGLAGRTLIPRISVAARAGKLLIFTFPGTYRKPTPWLGEKRRFCYFHLLKGIKIGEKRGKSYVGPFRGFLIKPVIGEILFLGGLNELKIIYDHVWAKKNILYVAHHTIILISIQTKIFIL